MKETWMKKNGFSDDIYVVCGGNTYPVKEELKENGFRYSKRIGWFSTEEKPIPAGYILKKFAFDDLYQWEDHHERAFPYADTEEKIKNVIYINKEKENDCK